MKDSFLAQRAPFSRSSLRVSHCHSKLLRHFSNLPINGNSRLRRHISAEITKREQVILKLFFSRATCVQHPQQLDPDCQAKFPSRRWWVINPWSFAQVSDGNSSRVQALWWNHSLIISMSPFIIMGLGVCIWEKKEWGTRKQIKKWKLRKEERLKPLKVHKYNYRIFLIPEV